MKSVEIMNEHSFTLWGEVGRALCQTQEFSDITWSTHEKTVLKKADKILQDLTGVLYSKTHP